MYGDDEDYADDGDKDDLPAGHPTGDHRVDVAGQRWVFVPAGQGVSGGLWRVLVPARRQGPWVASAAAVAAMTASAAVASTARNGPGGR
jgi:hypothetical protein